MKLGEERSRDVVKRAVDLALGAGADSAFALLRTTYEGLTRYSNNTIEMSTERFEPSLYIRVARGKHIAAGSVDNFDEDSLAWLVQHVLSLTAESPEASSVPELAVPSSDMPGMPPFDEEAAEMSPAARAALIQRMIRRVQNRNGVRLYGNAATGLEERAIANSNGVNAYFCGSIARLQVTALADSGGAGIARHLGRSMSLAVPEELADTAIDKAARFNEFADISPGDYEVVLEPGATAEVLFHTGYLGFGGAGHLNGSSCFAGQVGQQVLSPLVTIWDDPLHPLHMYEPFDWEGVPRKKICLVAGGTINGPVYDLGTARKAGTVSTGHGLPPEGAWFSEGPFPSHMVLVPGKSSRSELVSHVERGVLVTSFHYTRPLNHRQAVITGMTRNGTFLIEDGKVSAMLPNLRFAFSTVRLLAGVLEVGSDLKLAGDYNWNVAPSIRAQGFTVTGKTG